jgi:hypothetical protein
MKKMKLAALVVLVLAISQCTLGQEPSAADTKELEAAEAQMFEKVGPHDPAYLKDFVAQNYFSINADGGTEDKAHLLADIGSGKAKIWLVYSEVVRQANTGVRERWDHHGTSTGLHEGHGNLCRGVPVHCCIREAEG